MAVYENMGCSAWTQLGEIIEAHRYSLYSSLLSVKYKAGVLIECKYRQGILNI